MAIVVQKYGGSSVADVSRIQQVAELPKDKPAGAPGMPGHGGMDF